MRHDGANKFTDFDEILLIIISNGGRGRHTMEIFIEEKFAFGF